MAITGIRYPADLQVEKDTDYFKIQVLSYTRNPGLTSGASTTVSGVENILLPMPSNIQDSNNVSWGEEKMNSIAAAAVGGVQATQDIDLNFNQLPQSFADAGTRIQNAISASGLTLPLAQELFKKQLAAEAVNIFGGNVSLDQILARQTGAIFNPNLELLFNGVSLRDFRFSFKMTPRDEDERDNVIKIIRTFKRYMSAQRGGKVGDIKNDKNLFLTTPYVFQPSYMKGTNLHPFLHKFKACALKGVSTNYTGENVYATYYDGTPISVVIDLNFQELVPIYNDEYPDINSDVKQGVGY